MCDIFVFLLRSCLSHLLFIVFIVVALQFCPTFSRVFISAASIAELNISVSASVCECRVYYSFIIRLFDRVCLSKCVYYNIVMVDFQNLNSIDDHKL